MIEVQTPASGEGSVYLCCGPIAAKTKSTSLHATVACARNMLIEADYGTRQVFADLIDLVDLRPAENTDGIFNSQPIRKGRN